MNRPFLLACLALVVVAVGVVLFPWRQVAEFPLPGDRPPPPDGTSGEPTLAGRGEAARQAGQPSGPGVAPDPAGSTAAEVRVWGEVRLRGEGVLVPSGAVRVLADPPPPEVGGTQVFSGDIHREGHYTVQVPRGATLRSLQVERHPWNQDLPVAFLRTEVDPRDQVLDADLRLDLEVDPGVVVTGRVRSRATRAPVGGARVVLLAGAAPGATAVADADGRYLLSGVPPDVLDSGRGAWLEASAPGHGSARARLPALAVERRREEGFDLLLEPGVRLRGHVTLPEGGRAAGVRVFAWAPRPPEIGLGRRVIWLGEAVLDDALAFDLGAAAAPAAATVEVQGANEWGHGFGLGAQRDEVDLTAANPRVDFTLGASARLVVGATFPDGRRVPGQDLVVAFWDEAGVPRTAQVHGRATRYLEVAPGRSVELHVHTTRSGEAGRPETFAGRALATAPVAPAEGFPAAAHVTVPLAPWARHAVPPAWRGVGLLGMNTAAAWHEVRMTFVDGTSGAPLAGRGIRFRAAGASSATALSVEGRVRLALGPGRVFLHVEVEGYEPETVLLDPFEARAEEAELRMTPLP